MENSINDATLGKILCYDLRTGDQTAMREEIHSLSMDIARGHGAYLIPSLVSALECDKLMEEATSSIKDEWISRHRVPIAELIGAHSLCDSIIRRTLSLVEEQLPYLGRLLFKQTCGLSDLDVSFSLNEPAINVYGEGATFEEHKDGHQLTVLVPLSEHSDFTGGGTAFWPTAADTPIFEEKDHHRGLVRDATDAPRVLQPARGTGIIFTGSVQHAGIAVTSGVRQVLVASFNLWPWGCGMEPQAHRMLTCNRRTPQQIMAMADGRSEPEEEGSDNATCHAAYDLTAVDTLAVDLAAIRATASTSDREEEATPL